MGRGVRDEHLGVGLREGDGQLAFLDKLAVEGEVIIEGQHSLDRLLADGRANLQLHLSELISGKQQVYLMINILYEQDLWNTLQEAITTFSSFPLLTSWPALVYNSSTR